MKLFFLALAALVAPVAAIAADKVELSSSVFVEKTALDSHGRQTVVLEEPTRVVPGDRLVFVLKYHNVGDRPATDFVVTNPMPRAVAFQKTLDGTEQVSIDGGKSWGRLKDLRTSTDGGYRAAVPEDVTHIRWNFSKAISAGYRGNLTFRGTVR